MSLKFVLIFCVIFGVSFAHKIKLYNNCPFTVWPGIQGNPGHQHLKNGGFSLGMYKAVMMDAPQNWAGRIWARTRCNDQGKCETGDCGKYYVVGFIETSIILSIHYNSLPIPTWVKHFKLF